MLENQLVQLGYNEKEARIFLALSEMGMASVQQLADRCDLARSSIYGFTKKLLEQRIIVWGQRDGKKVLTLGNHDALLQSIWRQQEELQAREKVAEDLAKRLKQNSSKDRPPPVESQTFRGKKEIEAMLYEYQPKMLRSYIRLNYYTMWGYQDHSFVDEYRSWHEHTWSERLPRQDIKLFSTKEGMKQQKTDDVALRELRELPLGNELGSSVWIHGEYVLLANTRNAPHTAVLIFEPSLAANLREVFQLLWRMTEKASN